VGETTEGIHGPWAVPPPFVPHLCLQPTLPFGAFTSSKTQLKSSLKMSPVSLAQLIRVSRLQVVNIKCQGTQHCVYKRPILRAVSFTPFIYSGSYWYELSI